MKSLLDLGHPEPPPISIDEAVQIIRELTQIIIDMGLTDADQAELDVNINATLTRAHRWVFNATVRFQYE